MQQYDIIRKLLVMLAFCTMQDFLCFVRTTTCLKHFHILHAVTCCKRKIKEGGIDCLFIVGDPVFAQSCWNRDTFGVVIHSGS